MKKLFALRCLAAMALFLPAAVAAETPEDTVVIANEKVFGPVEQPPMFPGGDKAMYAFINKNLRYPAVAAEMNIQGRVVLQFVVEKNGSISGIKVIRSVDEDLDREAVRIVRMMPRFSPGKMNGRPLRVRYTLPIDFHL